MEWMLRPLRRYADFSGRSQRQEYWMFVLFSALLYAAAIIVLVVFAGMSESAGKPDGEPAASGGILVGILILLLLYLGLFIPTLAAQVRRLHDQDLSGWFALLGFIPNLGWLIMLIFMCIDGTAGPNRFGPDPKGRGGDFHADVFA